MPIRNPFARRSGAQAPNHNDENLLPEVAEAPSHPGFEKVDTVGSKASSALSIGSSRRSHDTGEYKLSVVNDSGIYLPPSPIEKEASWPKRYLSRNSTETRSSMGGEIEHFSISRESFDSYRRSFDISARSPVVNHDTPPTRQSLDSALFARPPRASLSDRRAFERESPTVEEDFEDVGLSDEQQSQQNRASPGQQQQPQPHKKRGFFSKFGSDSHSDQQQTASISGGGSSTASSAAMMSRFLMTGRRRAQSGSQELGNMERPVTANSSEGVEAKA